MHRLVHRRYGDDNRLIWLYDIHLIGESLTPTQWSELVAISQRKQIARACHEGLEMAHICFKTQLDDAAMQDLQQAGKLEPPFMPTSDSQLAAMLAEFRAIPHWNDRVRLLRENLFPSASYMIKRDKLTSNWQLPGAYIQRIFKGIAKRRG